MKLFKNQLKIFVAGFLVLAVTSILLRWGRTYCQYDGDFSPPTKNFGFTLKNFIKEFDDNPGTNGFPFGVSIKRDAISNLRALPYLRTYISGTGREELKVKDLYQPSLWGTSSNDLVYFNERLGLVVHSRAFKESVDNKSWWSEEILSYAGPEGVSKTPDPALGRFRRLARQMSMDWMTLIFDKELRRFYSVDFNKKTVVKSNQLAKDKEYLRIVPSDKASFYLQWPSSVTEAIQKKLRIWFPGPVTLVVDQTGRIDRFDYQAMKIIGKAGYLPDLPRHLLEYNFMPFSMGNEYKGLAVASVNQDLVLILSVFDAEGNRIKHDGWPLISWEIPRQVEYGQPLIIFWKIFIPRSWTPERILPPIGSPPPAQTGIFLLPNSLVGRLSRKMADSHWLERLTVPFLVMFPTIILVIILTIIVDKDAKLLGLSYETRRGWVLGTIAFGLPAYITWRIVRPNIVMVTCQNCGKLRRPDFENCQRCKSPWQVPELVPPLWRVYGEPDAEQTPAPPDKKVESPSPLEP